ncbi:hypothetical protein, conserved [Eimeria maxima]|uniref:Uncharacterized protein n=1 Tax=Eimeria maxima TaxID=5804 RepID=U6M901_EIMMA|nr:hypothetical protein, conserved [Eimeria maxima]CDJ60682.1 hypothetical protein, conserved [Eimeria maxima]
MFVVVDSHSVYYELVEESVSGHDSATSGPQWTRRLQFKLAFVGCWLEEVDLSISMPQVVSGQHDSSLSWLSFVIGVGWWISIGSCVECYHLEEVLAGVGWWISIGSCVECYHLEEFLHPTRLNLFATHGFLSRLEHWRCSVDVVFGKIGSALREQKVQSGRLSIGGSVLGVAGNGFVCKRSVVHQPQPAGRGVGVGLRMVLGDEGVVFGALEQRMADMQRFVGELVLLAKRICVMETMGSGDWHLHVDVSFGWIGSARRERKLGPERVRLKLSWLLRVQYLGTKAGACDCSVDALVCWIGSGFHQLFDELKPEPVRLKLIAPEALVFTNKCRCLRNVWSLWVDTTLVVSGGILCLLVEPPQPVGDWMLWWEVLDVRLRVDVEGGEYCALGAVGMLANHNCVMDSMEFCSETGMCYYLALGAVMMLANHTCVMDSMHGWSERGAFAAGRYIRFSDWGGKKMFVDARLVYCEVSDWRLDGSSECAELLRDRMKYALDALVQPSEQVRGQHGNSRLSWPVLVVDLDCVDVLFGWIGSSRREHKRVSGRDMVVLAGVGWWLMALGDVLGVGLRMEFGYAWAGGVGVELRMVLGDKGVIFGVLEQRMADMVVGGNGAEVDVCGSLGCIEVVTRYAGGVVGLAFECGCVVWLDWFCSSETQADSRDSRGEVLGVGLRMELEYG